MQRWKTEQHVLVRQEHHTLHSFCSNPRAHYELLTYKELRDLLDLLRETGYFRDLLFLFFSKASVQIDQPLVLHYAKTL